MYSDFKKKFFKDEKLIMIPKKEPYRIAVMDYIYENIENKEYSEKEINEAIKKYYDDYAYIRRYFVDNHYFARDNEGKIYKKIK